MNNNSVEELRAQIINAAPSFNDSENFNNSENLNSSKYKEYKDEWWLLGTAGCHLCTQAEQLLAQFQAVYPITYQHIDIADFDEPLMMTFATTIPVLLTKTQRLNYPFSVMDLQRLL
ncbi:glutaredoxin family protein [Psychrobacter urativorans]|uniref:Glutaredoxin n=1 Tax=Psychrobacter urativorans TaxID=45610 RepID=A0A0M4U5L7_9GAMM|nr:glutaredoxin family protein [Psychrobacter urativorans]ALF60256.1 glutaredoxin [Psychrobacter urativorans]